jgi:hypothetical protein
MFKSMFISICVPIKTCDIPLKKLTRKALVVS